MRFCHDAPVVGHQKGAVRALEGLDQRRGVVEVGGDNLRDALLVHERARLGRRRVPSDAADGKRATAARQQRVHHGAALLAGGAAHRDDLALRHCRWRGWEEEGREIVPRLDR
jgi:hypothetical protein